MFGTKSNERNYRVCWMGPTVNIEPNRTEWKAKYQMAYVATSNECFQSKFIFSGSVVFLILFHFWFSWKVTSTQLLNSNNQFIPYLCNSNIGNKCVSLNVNFQKFCELFEKKKNWLSISWKEITFQIQKNNDHFYKKCYKKNKSFRLKNFNDPLPIVQICRCWYAALQINSISISNWTISTQNQEDKEL